MIKVITDFFGATIELEADTLSRATSVLASLDGIPNVCPVCGAPVKPVAFTATKVEEGKNGKKKEISFPMMKAACIGFPSHSAVMNKDDENGDVFISSDEMWSTYNKTDGRKEIKQHGYYSRMGEVASSAGRTTNLNNVEDRQVQHEQPAEVIQDAPPTQAPKPQVDPEMPYLPFEEDTQKELVAKLKLLIKTMKPVLKAFYAEPVKWNDALNNVADQTTKTLDYAGYSNFIVYYRRLAKILKLVTDLQAQLGNDDDAAFWVEALGGDEVWSGDDEFTMDELMLGYVSGAALKKTEARLESLIAGETELADYDLAEDVADEEELEDVDEDSDDGLDDFDLDDDLDE